MKNSIDEPPEVELKDLPPHLEYAFLEGDNKLPVIIAKDLSVGEKAALIKVLQSHKRAIAWKLSDIKGPLPTAALPLASAMQQEHSEIMMAIFKNDQKNDWKCFWMTFRVFGSSFYNAYLLEKMLKRVFVTTTNLARNWEKAISWLRKALFLYINLQVRDCPDCKDSRALSFVFINKSFTFLRFSILESSIQSNRLNVLSFGTLHIWPLIYVRIRNIKKRNKKKAKFNKPSTGGKGPSQVFLLVTLIASSLSKSSSTKGDVLEGGGVSSNVTLSDSLTFLVWNMRSDYADIMTVLGLNLAEIRWHSVYQMDEHQSMETREKVREKVEEVFNKRPTVACSNLQQLAATCSSLQRPAYWNVGKVGDKLKECNEEVMGNLRDCEMVDNEMKVCPNQSVDVDKGVVENDGKVSFGFVDVDMLKMCDGIRKNNRSNEDDMQGIKEIEQGNIHGKSNGKIQDKGVDSDNVVYWISYHK
ncbi:hypothetical protein Tco_0387107 [Tanacetum coccineum]